MKISVLKRIYSTCQQLIGKHNGIKGLIRNGHSFFAIILTAISTVTCQGLFAQTTKAPVIVISNATQYPIQEKVIEIPWYQVMKGRTAVDTTSLVVVEEKGKAVPFQLETKGENKIHNILVKVSVPAGGRLRLRMTKGKRKNFASEVYCRHVPERYGDFAWENDKIAFRMYGKALESTSFNAKGIDVWAKRTNRLVINKWYQSEDYHTDHGEGLDFYGVGNTLGAGDVAPFIEDSIWFPKNYVRYQVLENGPLRCSFRLYYNEWKAGTYSVSAMKTITLDAGEQLSKVEAVFRFNKTPSLSIGVGINLKNGTDVKLLDKLSGMMAYWLPPDSLNGTIGVGTVFLDTRIEMTEVQQHLLAKTVTKSDVPFTYYTGACWDKSGVIKNAWSWIKYLRNFWQTLKQPPLISME